MEITQIEQQKEKKNKLLKMRTTYKTYRTTLSLLTIELYCYNRQVARYSSVTQSYSTFWDHVECITPGLPVHHQNLEFTPTHVH